MGKFVFTYNAKYDEHTGAEIRKEVIIFLQKYGAINIKQCLETTFVFDNIGRTTEEWYQLIQKHLDGDKKVLDDGFYLLNKVSYTKDGLQIKNKCDHELQNFVDSIINP